MVVYGEVERDCSNHLYWLAHYCSDNADDIIRRCDFAPITGWYAMTPRHPLFMSYAKIMADIIMRRGNECVFPYTENVPKVCNWATIGPVGLKRAKDGFCKDGLYQIINDVKDTRLTPYNATTEKLLEAYRLSWSRRDPRSWTAISRKYLVRVKGTMMLYPSIRST